MPDEPRTVIDVDSAGVYQISVEAFEARTARPNASGNRLQEPAAGVHSSVSPASLLPDTVSPGTEERVMRPWIGVAAAAIAMYLFGFAYWGASSFPYAPWLETADDAAAGQALLEHFPKSGVYYLPANGNDPQERTKLYDAGPVGFVFIDVDGRPEFDPGIMARGFLLNVAVAALMLWLFRVANIAPRHGSRIGLAAIVALTFVAMVHLGDVIWWVLPLNWEISQAFYNFTAFMLGASVLSAVMGTEEPN